MRVLNFAACFAVTSLLTCVAASGQSTTSPSDCADLWKQADKSLSGSLTQEQAIPFISDFSAVDADKDGKISNAEFMKGCSSGQIHKGGGASGSTGSNSRSIETKTMVYGTGSSGSGASGSSGVQPMPSH